MTQRIALAAGGLRVELSPAVGGSVAAFMVRGQPVFRPAPPDFDDVLQAACFPLVPYSNRVFDGRFEFAGRNVVLARNNPPQRHPLHGLGWRNAWAVEAASAAAARLAFDWPGGDWPWPFRAEQAFALEDGELTIALSVTNLADSPMPAGLGLHPYFPCPPGTVLDAAVEEVWTVDADLFPNGRQAPTGRYDLERREIHHADLDNGYGGWAGEATIAWPDGAGVRIRSAERYFQVYAPVTEDVLCAEPVSHANGALNANDADRPKLGLKTLEPGASLTLKSTFSPFTNSR